MELKIARVEQAAVLGVIEQAERGAEDVSGREQRHGRVAGELFGLAEGQQVLHAFARHARPHQSRGRRRTDDFFVPGAMVGVRVRHDCAVGWLVRIEPPVDLGEENSVLVLDVPRHGVATVGL